MTHGDGWVQGYLLELTDPQILVRLDAYEDYDPQQPEAKNLYRREWRPIYDPETRASLGLAWMYLMALHNVQAMVGVQVCSGEWWSDLDPS